jgi:hypothetical protein
MGWKSRNRPKWTEHHVVLLSVGLVALLACFWVVLVKVGMISHRQIAGTEDLDYYVQSEPAVVYGWRNVPPANMPGLDMTRVPRTAWGGVDFTCSMRHRDRTGRWLCDVIRPILNPRTLVIAPADPNATRAPS